MKPVLALDIGGTKLAVGAVSRAGEVLAEVKRPTDASAPPTAILDSLLAMSREAVHRAGLSLSALSAAGVAFGGPMDYPRGLAVTCHHLPGWEGFPIREAVAEKTGLPAFVDNDANAAALGETAFGAARGLSHVLYLTVSTGIGGGVILGGRVHRGANSLAGEIGHTIVLPDGPPCTCGKRGCLEAVASGPAIARAAREALARGEESALSALPPKEITARHIAEAADRDPLARKILTAAGRHLGTAVAAAANLLNPQMVVIGGGVSQSGEVLFSAIRSAVSEAAVTEIARGLRIAPGALGPRSALLGAAALALSETPLSPSR